MPTELHPFFFSACSLPFFQEVQGIGRISFPYLERKEVSSCRLRGKLSSLLSRDVSYLERKAVSSCRLSGKRSPLLSHKVGGACLSFLRWGPLLSKNTEGSSLLVEDEVENLYVVFEDWRRSVHVH